MAGGIWITQNKIRPGLYHKYTAKPAGRSLFGDIGVVSMPLELNWGPVGEIISIDADATTLDFQKAFGYRRDDVLLVREALKRGLTLLAYRVGGGTNASLTTDEIVATAKYPGTRGNDISITFTADTVATGATQTYTVKTLVDNLVMDEQSGLTALSEIAANDWVTWTPVQGGSFADLITADAGGPLTGGANTAGILSEYQAYLTALEAWEVQAVALPNTDATILAHFIDEAERWVDELGKLVQFILPENSADHESVTSIKNGVVLRDGTTLTSAQATAWYAGASASAGPTKSLTYARYDDAVAPATRYSDAQIKAALNAGHVVFVSQRDVNGKDVCAVEQDINTRVTVTANRPKVWRKNKVVRALYYLVWNISRVWHLYYIGQVNNNADGRDLFKADVVTMMGVLVPEAYEDFTPSTDVIVAKGEESDAVTCRMFVRPVDAMEKMYLEVEIQ